jgi:homoserine kinase
LKAKAGFPHLRAVEAVAPASSANLGAGFDVFGVALDHPKDILRAEVTSVKGLRITTSGEGSHQVPLVPERNTAGIVALELLKASKREVGLSLKIRKGIRPGSGMGSSAASAAACATAVNELLGLGLSETDRVKYAALGERASAGVAHYDNVAASIFGGFVLISSDEPLEVLRLPSCDVEFAIVLPDVSYTTSQARAVLPRRVDIGDMVYNVSKASAFVAGLAKGDVGLMGRSMTDSVVEAARESLIPGLRRVKRAALAAGAAGATISGSGPAVLAIVDPAKAMPREISKAMKEVFDDMAIGCRAFSCKPGGGARVTARISD